MEIYRLDIPTKVYYGRNIWKEALKEEESLLPGNIMIVTTGRSLIRMGYIDELKEQLQAGFHAQKLVIFDKVSANPRISEIKEAAALGRQEGVGTVIGFGGGSALDAAKAAAVSISGEESLEDFFYQGKEPKERLARLVAIPTTAGTGSELSRAAILTDEIQKKKSGIRGNALYPDAAVVDSAFTESVPFKITMETGFDVLAHAVESYVSRAASPYTRMQSESAVRIVGACLPRLASDLGDVRAREQMSFASMIMGINLANAGTGLPHRMQYPVGAHTDTSHGAGLAALYTAWAGYEYQYAKERMETIAGLLTGAEVRGKGACVNAVRQFIKQLELPSSLQKLGVEKSQLAGMASEVSGNIGNDPAAQEENILLKIYEAAWQEG
ncbi:MAG: iron-containing alcohol dehydrogenase [Ruminococcus flavefaciens]|nr:iron-containing alcohol dehydrogenase [Ruminococcus flavefaciens]